MANIRMVDMKQLPALIKRVNALELDKAQLAAALQVVLLEHKLIKDRLEKLENNDLPSK
jgi:hypothetical protein